MLRDHLLTIHSDVEGHTGYLVFEGELIAETRFEPERIFREWLEAGIVNVVVSCAGLRHIDSAGFSILLGALHRFRRNHGDLVLVEVGSSLHKIFEQTAMHKYFNIYQDYPSSRRHFDQLETQKHPATRPSHKSKTGRESKTRK